MITIETAVRAPVDQVWAAWTQPEHIVQWNFASDDWCCPGAEIDLSIGGKFSYRMDAKDGSMGFDFEGTFTRIEMERLIEYVLEDGRKVVITFEVSNGGTRLVESFEAENAFSGEQQRQGWQAILDNFRSHVERVRS